MSTSRIFTIDRTFIPPQISVTWDSEENKDEKPAEGEYSISVYGTRASKLKKELYDAGVTDISKAYGLFIGSKGFHLNTFKQRFLSVPRLASCKIIPCNDDLKLLSTFPLTEADLDMIENCFNVWTTAHMHQTIARNKKNSVMKALSDPKIIERARQGYTVSV